MLKLAKVIDKTAMKYDLDVIVTPQYGCHSVTVTDDIMKLLISHPMTDAAIAGFERDWQGVYGDKTIKDF